MTETLSLYLVYYLHGLGKVIKMWLGKAPSRLGPPTLITPIYIDSAYNNALKYFTFRIISTYVKLRLHYMTKIIKRLYIRFFLPQETMENELRQRN